MQLMHLRTWGSKLKKKQRLNHSAHLLLKKYKFSTFLRLVTCKGLRKFQMRYKTKKEKPQCSLFSKKRRNQSSGEGQHTRWREKKKKKKKKEEEDLIGDVNVVATWCTGVRSNHAFLLFFLLVFVPAEFLFSSRNVRYTPVRPVLSGIGRYLERYILKVFRYRFIDRYEEFRPYRPVRYGINILASKSSLVSCNNF